MSVSPKLIGVCGYAQHGKDTVGGMLVEHFGYERHAFADQLKAMALVLDPIIYASTDPLYAGEIERLSHWVEAAGWEGAKKNPEVRRFLQVLGTEAVRDMIGENAWVDALDKVVFNGNKKFEDAQGVVVTDVRFPNEADYIRRNRGIIIKVTRPGHDSGVSRDHPSEAHISTLPYDYGLDNGGTLEDLRVGLVSIMLRERTFPKAKWQRSGE